MAVKFTISADGKRAEAEIKNVARAFGNLGKQTKSTGKQTQGATKKMVAGYATVAAAAITLQRAVRGVVRFARESVAAAGEQQAAEVKLATALKSTGQFSDELFESLKRQSVEIQKLTAADDEATLAQQALAVSMGVPVEKLGEMSLALENAKAAGLPTETLLRGLAASFSGNASALTRYIPAVRELTEEQLRQGGAIELINQQFGGMAENMRGTWLGATKAFTGAWGDVKEAIGTIITDTPRVRAALLAAADTFLDMSASIAENAKENQNTVANMVDNIISGVEIMLKAMLRVKQGIDGVGATVEHVLVNKLRGELESAREELARTESGVKSMNDTLLTGAPIAYAKDTSALREEILSLEDQLRSAEEAADKHANQYQETADAIKELDRDFDDLRTKIDETEASLRAATGETREFGDALDDAGDEAGNLADELEKIQESTGLTIGAWVNLGGEFVRVTRENITAIREQLDWMRQMEEPIQLTITTELLTASEAFAALKERREEVQAGLIEFFEESRREAEDVAHSVSRIGSALAESAIQGEGFKGVLRVTAQELIRQISQIATAAIAAQAATSAKAVAGSTATLSASAPAAIAKSIETEGGAALGGAAAAIAAITALGAIFASLVGSIGDAGILNRGGAGRSVVMKRDDEILIDPKGTTQFREQMSLMTDIVRGASGGFMPGGGGSQGQEMNVTVQTFLDGEIVAENTERRMATRSRRGMGEFSREALVSP